ncbi:hypothetical protein [Maridesulfovibrio hydrothermalis]|uniref:hypothetical protein n=1 Tax=Maridesulfovibrio hydrothermalis TaxID=191026 RepID=UPI00031A6F48|nr:hypothetical protein [Maridesulfovibrio hydrothermalis]
MSNSFGNWFETQRTKNLKAWKMLFVIFLVVLVALNFFIHPHHAEYHYDIYPGFWELFALGVSVAMVFVMKVLIQPFLVGPEESDDN